MGIDYYVGRYNSRVSKLNCNILHHQFIPCNISLARCVVTAQHSIHSPLTKDKQPNSENLGPNTTIQQLPKEFVPMHMNGLM